MKVARYAVGETTTWGVLDEDGDYTRLEGSPLESVIHSGQRDRAGDVRLLAPLPAPRVFGVGLNYRSHAAEAGQAEPEFPMLFMKPSTTVIGPDEAIVYPPEARNTHFEGELAVVIGRKARRVEHDSALEHVFGYTCANDVSEREIQFAEMATGCLLVGKGFDTFCPLGPLIATGLDPTDLKLETRVNGKLRQSISTSDLLFSVADLVVYLSRSTTLLPGDVISTGTPAGVGPLMPGDVIEIEIEGIGTLRNPVVAEASA